MEYKVNNNTFPNVEITLAYGESVVTESGRMIWMTPNIQMETHAGKAGKAFGRILSGEKFFQNKFTAENGSGKVTLGTRFVGAIKEIDIEPGKEFIISKGAFLACEEGVELSMHVTEKLSTGIFGGEGFFLGKLSGQGKAFTEIDGEFIEYELKEGEQLVVNTGNIAGFDASVKMDIKQVKGAKNVFFGGAGFFHTTLTGPGRVWVQTMPIKGLAEAIQPYIYTGSDN